MIASSPHQNGAIQHWLTVRAEPVGAYTAQAVGLPEICATAATREEAVRRVNELLRGRLASGQLISLDLPAENPLLNWVGHDPNDPDEQAFLEELARAKQEDLENTLRELDQGCSSSSSTPTI